MSNLLKSDFVTRFAGGFLLGVIALVGLQHDRVSANLGWAPTETARAG